MISWPAAVCADPAGISIASCDRAKAPNAWPARRSAAVTQGSGRLLVLQAVVRPPKSVIELLSWLNAELVWLSAAARFTVPVFALLAATATTAMYAARMITPMTVKKVTSRLAAWDMTSCHGGPPGTRQLAVDSVAGAP